MNLNYNVFDKGLVSFIKKMQVFKVDQINQKTKHLLGSLFLLLSLIIGQKGFAQVANYTFSQSTGTYTPITGGSNLNGFTSFTNTSFLDDNSSTALEPIGFNFTYNGVVYTQFGFNANGFITLGALPISSYNSLSTGTSNNVISALNNDLMGRGTFLINRTSGSPTVTVTSGDISLISVGDKVSGTGIPAGATVLSKTATTVTMSANATTTGSGSHFRFSTPNTGIRYETIGTSPNRTLVVQWTGFHRYTTNGAFGELYNFQIRLSEGTNNIEFVYNIQGPTSTTANQYQVGLRGSSNADFNNRTSTTSWSASTAGATNASTLTLSNTVKPATGLTYTFVPPAPPACTLPSSVSITLTSATTASVSWSGAASAVVEWGASGCVAGTGATAGACGSVVSGSSPQTITGLTLGTAYSVYVRQDCTGSGNGYSTNVNTPFTPTAGESCTITQTITVAPDLGSAVNTLLTTGLTSDGPNGTCSNSTGNPSKRDRWVSFVAPTSGNKVIITTSSGTISDAVMQVWSACPASGIALGCSDDVVGNMPQLEFCSLTPGATYYVQLWPYSDTAGNFNIRIYEDVVCAVPPANDECAGVETITVGAPGSCPGAATSGTTVDATATPGVVKTTCDAFGTYNDVFYKFNSGANTSLNFAFTNLTGTNEFGIYTDCGLTYGGICSSSSLTTNITGLTANTDYFIVVWANSAAVAGTFSICISTPPAPNCVAAPTAPANASTTVNPCAVTLSWPAVPGALTYDVYLDAGAGPATTLVSPAQAGTSYVAGILAGTTGYSWRIVPKNGTGDAVGCSDFTFTTTGAPACTTLTAPADLATICAGPTTFTWAAAAGATSYEVYLDTVLVSTQAGTSYSQSVAAGPHAWSIVPLNCIGAATGCVDFTFTANGNPTGDTFATAIDLGVITASTSANGDNQTSNCWRNDYTTTSTPGNSLARPGNEVFYKFEITECGSLMDIGTCTSSFDTYVHLLNAAGTRINGDDDSCTTPNTAGSLLTTLALNPGIYYLVVEGYDAAALGTFTLDLTYVSGTPQITYYQDSDADGFGNSAVSQLACTQPVGYVTDSSDCNDAITYYTDSDNDGFGALPKLACGTVTNTADCDDATVRWADVDGDTFGSATVKVACGGVTNNTDCNDNQIQYFDGDSDNYGTAVQVACGVVLTGDCNDANPAIRPNATEICYNGIDDNCNGFVNETACVVPTVNMTSTTATLTTFSNAVAANLYSLSPYTNLKYRFIITKIQTGQANEVQEVTLPTRYVTIPGPMRSYTATYTISAAAVINDEVLAYQGNTMTVTPPAVPAITLSTGSCGATLT
ncbi:MopE-related protein, partial [Flavobacterium sp.]|uniref:MopE-related protein n=1 Tax=Flavobacterium sp. TaxID=239 RepID=UPI0037C09362